MSTVTIKGFLAVRRSIITGKDEFHFFNTKMDEHGCITVMPYEMTFELPANFNMTAEQVKCLQAQKAKLREEFDLRVMAINEEISKLQCLEFDPKATA